MKTFAPLIIFVVAVIIIVVGGVLYQGRWRERRVRRNHFKERGRARNQHVRGDIDAAPEGDS